MQIDNDDEFDGEGPIDTLERWFDAHGWSHERLSGEEVVASTQGAWGAYELRGVWREDDGVLQFLAFPDIRVTSAQVTLLHEASTLR